MKKNKEIKIIKCVNCNGRGGGIFGECICQRCDGLGVLKISLDKIKDAEDAEND